MAIWQKYNNHDDSTWMFKAIRAIQSTTAPPPLFINTPKAETVNYPEEVKIGMLVPLQKPGKPKSPSSSLRPIILLSMLRNILAICLLRRISNKINDEITITQAAYHSGRSTTEQIFTMKILADKAITSTYYSAQMLLMYMPKAFDTVHRHHILLEDLRSILDADELHLIKILIEDVTIAAKIKGKT